MKKIITLALILIIASTIAFAEAREIKLYKQQTIECVRTKNAIAIDGLLDDPVWKTAKSYNMYLITTTDAPLSYGTVKILYDDQNLYIYMKAKDKDIKAYVDKSDGPTCEDDVLEMFIRPGKNCPWYYNAEINAIGTAYTGKNHVGGGGTSAHWAKLWDPSIDYAIFIKGTLNNPNDVDDYWALEAKVPFAVFDVLKDKAPKAGDVWYCNFAKYDYSIYLPASIEGMELSSVCHTHNVWFHEVPNYCPLVFK